MAPATMRNKRMGQYPVSMMPFDPRYPRNFRTHRWMPQSEAASRGAATTEGPRAVTADPPYGTRRRVQADPSRHAVETPSGIDPSAAEDSSPFRRKGD
jgi:hypothetical protein